MPVLLSQESSRIEELSIGDEESFEHTNDLISSLVNDSQASDVTVRLDGHSIHYYDDFDEPAVRDKEPELTVSPTEPILKCHTRYYADNN